uniref:Uncharacterized protein n=1 Tax=Micrurus paraensis TaxID=1970185 RepID=A0A2D4L523_9SAUR
MASLNPLSHQRSSLPKCGLCCLQKGGLCLFKCRWTDESSSDGFVLLLYHATNQLSARNINPSIPHHPVRAEEASWMRSETSSKKKQKVQLPLEKKHTFGTSS